MTRLLVLIAACGAAAAMSDTDITLPFRGHQCACGDASGSAATRRNLRPRWRTARPTMTRTRPLGSHRLRRCTDVLYIPSSAVPVDDRHVVGYGESRSAQPGPVCETVLHRKRAPPHRYRA